MAHTTLYEEDLEYFRQNAAKSDIKIVNVGFVGVKIPVEVNPGKRPRRKKGESPLDPPSN